MPLAASGTVRMRDVQTLQRGAAGGVIGRAG